jgi:hypothetical protein
MHGARSAVHQDRDTEGFGNLFGGGAASGGAAGMRRHTAVALFRDRDGERNEFLGLGIECAVTEGRAGEGAVAVEHRGDVVVEVLHGLAELVEDRFVGHGNLLLGSGM